MASRTTITDTEMDVIVQRVVENAITTYKELNMKNIFSCVIMAMELVETVTTLSGGDKLKIVKKALSQIVQKCNIPAEDKKIIEMFIDSDLIDVVISGIVFLTKNGCKINLQQLEETIKKTCGCGKCVML